MRRHPITGDPILYAPDRATRPNAFAGAVTRERCPFCPGHEGDTPPAIAVSPEEGPWSVRVVPNKYPATEGHEVIIESPRHGTSFDRIEHQESVLRTSLDRVAVALASYKHVTLFKNHGGEAGASIDHVHSQLVPLSFVPPRARLERTAFLDAAVCPLCAMAETTTQELLIERTEHFLRVAPHGSTAAYQQWIVPISHRSTFTALSEVEIADLSAMLVRASSGMLTIAGSYNWMFLIFPGCDSAHAYIEAFPRLARLAGFELATGTLIDIIDPAAAAQRYRTHDASIK